MVLQNVMTNLRIKLPPLTSLAAFEAVCRHLSFTKAANELCLTQAAVSRQIIALEKNLGVVLFERRSHNVALTSQGQWFANMINPAINTIADATVKVKSNQSNSLTLYTEPCIANYWLMPRISKYQALNPQTKVNLLTSNLDIDNSSEVFDIGMQYGTVNSKAYSQEADWRDELVVVTSREIFRKLPKKVELTDLLNFPLIHIDRVGAGWVAWSEFFAKYKTELPESHTSLVFNNYHSAVDAALHGAGICLGWRFVVGSLIEEKKLMRIGKFKMASPDDMFIYSRRSSANSQTALNFIQWVQQSTSN